METPETPHALAVGEMIEEFRIARVLGAGSFGIVYECQNSFLPETAAIKEFLPPELAYRGTDGQVMPLSEQTEETFNWARDRFLQEAKTLWELARPERHRNIVRVSRYCEANGTAYMFMEFEQGRSLSQIFEEQGRLSPQELDALFYPLLDGLERVHAADVLHRDIKPANILIRADGSPVLIDFGAARRVVAGGERSLVSAYTPVYAALEQYHEIGDQGPWTDIYGFAATLYQAVTGNRPLSAAERLCGGAQMPVVEECRGSYPEPILIAIDKALAIRPEDRPQSVSQWRRCLMATCEEAGADEATVVMRACGPEDPTRVLSPPELAQAPPLTSAAARGQAAKGRRGHGARIWLAVGTTALILIASGIGLYYWDALFPLAEREPPTKDIVSLPDDTPNGQPEAEERDVGEPAPADATVPKAPGQTIGRTDGSESGERKPDLSPSAKTRDIVEESAGDKPQQIEPASPPAPEPKVIPGARFSDSLSSGGTGPIMVWLPAGDFQMGSPLEEAGRNPDERRHLALVPEPFAVSETEVTLGQYRRFVEETDYRPEVGRVSTCFKPDESWQQLLEDWSLSWESPGYEVTDQHPVTCISWTDARAYAEWLTEMTGHQYRLPTEMEWEYAARGGTPSSRFWGDGPEAGCKYANVADCEDEHTYSAPAGTFPPNRFGLREVLGNLAEWTCSEYGKGYSGLEARCSETAGRSPRVFRGGSWLDSPELVRSAARDGAPANLGFNTVGFRLVRTLPAEKTGDETAAGQVAEKR